MALWDDGWTDEKKAADKAAKLAMPAEILPPDRILGLCRAEVLRAVVHGENSHKIVDLVLATIIGHTASPRTVDELTRIRGSVQ